MKRKSFFAEQREQGLRKTSKWNCSPLDGGDENGDEDDIWSFTGRTSSMQISLGEATVKTSFQVVESSFTFNREQENVIKRKKTPRNVSPKKRLPFSTPHHVTGNSPKFSMSGLSNQLRKLNDSASKVKARSLQTVRGRKSPKATSTPPRRSTLGRKRPPAQNSFDLEAEDRSQFVMSPIYQPAPDILDSSIVSEESPGKPLKRRRYLSDQSPRSSRKRTPVERHTQQKNITTPVECENGSITNIDADQSPLRSVKRCRTSMRPSSLFSSANPKASDSSFESHVPDDVLAVSQPGTPDSSIFFEASPLKRSTVRKRLVSRSPMTPTVDHISQFNSEHWSPVIAVHSQATDPSNHLSEIISSASTQSPEYKTPISVWIHQINETKADTTEKLSTQINRPLSGTAQKRKALPSTQTSTSLLESFMAIKTRYDSSTRLFAHDLRNGRYATETAMHLVIRKIVDIQDKTVQVIAYDVKENKDRWALFKPHDMLEFVEGACVMLYSPWQNIQIQDCEEVMIISTDFHKVVKNTSINLTPVQVTSIMELPFPTLTGIKTSNPLFMDIVPFHIKNQNTIERQLDQYNHEVLIDVVILYSWSQSSPSLYLVKDSSNFLSFLEVSKQFINSLDCLIPGERVKISKLVVAGKTFRKNKLAPFSVLHLFGGKQCYFYTFRWTSSSSAKLDPKIQIPSTGFKDVITDFDNIFSRAKTLDRRISIRCEIKEIEDDYILVTDDSSTGTLTIEYSPACEHQIRNIDYGNEEVFILRFVRVISGRAMWDMYTSYEQVNDY